MTMLLVSLLFFSGSFFNAFAESSSSLLPSAPQAISTLSPLKVSEINANLFAAMYNFCHRTLTDIFEAFVSLKDFVEVTEWAFKALQEPEIRDHAVHFCLLLLITLTISFFLAEAIPFSLRKKIVLLLSCRNAPPLKKLKNLTLALLFSTIAPLFFGFSFYSLSRFMSPHNELYLTIAHILSSGSASIWFLLNLARLFLTPQTAEQQHIPLSRDVLYKNYAWIRRIALTALMGFFILEIGRLIRLPIAGERLLLQGTGLVVTIMAIIMVSQLRKEINRWSYLQRKNNKLSPLKKAMLPYLNYSPFPFVILIGASYLSWTTHTYDPFLEVVWKALVTLAIFPAMRLFAFFLRKIRIFYLFPRLKKHFPILAHYILFHRRYVDNFILLFLSILSFIFVLKLWNLSPFAFLSSHLGKLLLERTLSIGMIIAISLGLTRAGNGLLNRYLSSTRTSDDTAKQQKLARFKTIYSVSRNILRIAVWTPAMLLIAIELGLNIIPLLTTVGIFSVGLSFGVQSLVKDFVTGFFMLLENTFAVGDLVLINGQLGRIESLTIRVVRLRSTDGSLHIFPYGNITSLSNQNKDFSAAVMLFHVGLNANLTQVFDILERIGKDLRKDPTVRSLISGPIKIDGVNAINDYSLEIRAVLRTKPGEYDKIRWAFNRLLKQYMESEDIPPPTPREICYNYMVEK